jgi:hypothetical protein
VKVNVTTPVHMFAKSSDVLSDKLKKIMHIKEPFKPRRKLEGEAPPPTFSHIKDGQVYKTDWATPTRLGAMEHLNIQSKGDSV